MATLHIENTVRDFDTWTAAFNKFERFRADNNVRSYRLSRYVEDPNKITVDLEFDSVEDATAFSIQLKRIHATPQSKSQLVTTTGPQLMETVIQQTL